MPNNSPRFKKKSLTRPASQRPRSGAARTIGELLKKPGGLFADALARADEQERWRRGLSACLPEPLSEHITGVAVSGGILTVFTESAAWCARLRYVLIEHEATLRTALPELRAIRVKVLPTAPGARRTRGDG